MTVRYATIGTSWITREFIGGAALAGGFQLCGVYSRSEETGRSFAASVGGVPVYTDLEKLAASDIDAVYIASPNSLHYPQSRLFLEHGKHVMCEKPATLDTAQLLDLQHLAASKNLVCIEALMFLYSPVRFILGEAIESAGKITSARLDFSQFSSRYYALKNGEKPNVFSNKKGGGCLMDLGMYCVAPMLSYFGEPAGIFCSALRFDEDTDLAVSAVFSYPFGDVSVTCSKAGQSRLGSEFIGERGTVCVESLSLLGNIRFINASGVSECLVPMPERRRVLSFEAQEFRDFVIAPERSENRLKEVCDASLGVARCLEKMRAAAGIKLG